jgi:hypothetical protein
MAKNYIDELSAWVKQREADKPRQDSATVAFIAVRENVIEAIEAGYALTTIWEHMHETGMIKFGYETFRKKTRQHIGQGRRKNKRDNEKKGKGAASRVEDEGPASDPTPAHEKGVVKGFKFSSIPNKEELF